ncbi:MAG TPA: hypothetical protein VEU55_03680 [Gemmatimonadales bacterium]|nr:hypothetical protein [Gemmatimonadales bacterium]
MRPRLAVLVALGALGCGGGTGPRPPAPQSPQQALAEFMAAVKANDLDRMGNLWGSERGPASGYMKPEDLHHRLTVFQIYLNHVGYRVLEGPMPVPGQEKLQRFRIELQRPNSCTVVFPIDLVHAKSGGWLVAAVDLASLPNPARGCAP